jgi:deoxyribodipyrimidine photo-lyase
MLDELPIRRSTKGGTYTMNPKRIRNLREGASIAGPVVYWMSRDQRAAHNWALLYAQELAITREAPLLVVFCLVPTFLDATIRQYGFMLKGLREADITLRDHAISFSVLPGSPEHVLPRFLTEQHVSVLVTDFDPMRVKRRWKTKVLAAVTIPCYEVDTHNVVPCWVASPKQEYAAYTFRPKVHRALPEFLEKFPSLKKHPHAPLTALPPVDWTRVEKEIRVDRSVEEVDWIIPGESAAWQQLQAFVTRKLASYDALRNDPTQDGQSNLSPYLHFGQLSPQQVALEVQGADAADEVKAAFLEELIVRRELSDNFLFYNDSYDTVEGLPAWARDTLDTHRKDSRPYLYTRDQLERADTHDNVWNAAQHEMMRCGKMHGYMRMYWAKKLLEWTETPEEALATGIYLNDKYELDGRDPNGYTGILWSVGGLHDRAWGERAIFGKVRYMSQSGLRSKFNARAYVEQQQATPR